MAKLKEFCQFNVTHKDGTVNECSRLLEAVEVIKLTDTEDLITYKCGHCAIKVRETVKPISFNPAAVDGSAKSLWDYQIEGVEKAIESDYNLLIADQMALGKTPQSLKALASNYDALTPCLIIVRSSTIWQWVKQYKVWCDPLPLGVFLISGTKSFIPPGFRSYLISMDSISRNGMSERLKEFGFKMVIVDEVHSFKDPSSKRTQALVDFIQTCNIKHKLFLSGTPIKNRADEYFVPLNLLRPDLFTSLSGFRYKWLEQDDKGKWGRVKEYMQKQFRDTIAPFVIRRERNEVLKDLPAFNRTFTEVEIESQSLKDLYNNELKKIEEKSGHKMSYWDLQDNLMTLRRITGMAKCEWAVDYTTQFLDETDDEKIAIGIHHHGVRDLLKHGFSKTPFGPNVLYLNGEDNPERKNKIIEEFQKPGRRVLVIGMLAGGVGLDGLQCCNNIITLERQWSAADEEQFEDRFNRPGQMRPVTAEYGIAKGTIDAYFCELVENKRKIFGSCVGNNWSVTNDDSSFREMIEWTVSHRLN